MERKERERLPFSRCKGCKKWIKIKEALTLRADGFCDYCHNTNKIRLQSYQKAQQYQNKNKWE